MNNCIAQTKRRYRAELLNTLELNVPEHTPIFLYIGRLASQKGLDIILAALQSLMAHDIVLLVLGKADASERYIEEDLLKAERRYPEKMKVMLRFDSQLAGMLYAAGTFIIIPSLYEPCGLVQMYAMANATLPIVHNVGGLSDTVRHFDPATKSGNGFVFEHPNAQGLLWAVGEALKVYGSGDMDMAMRNAVMADFSWDKSIDRYIQLYNEIRVGYSPIRFMTS